jgi:hypothetical protein
VSVCGTGALVYTGDFLGRLFERSALAEASTSPCGTATFNRRTFSQPAFLRFKCRRCGNIDPLAIVYAHRPRLRTRLTLGGRTFPRKPWVYGGQGFHLSYRYSCLHSHFPELHTPITRRLQRTGNALLPRPRLRGDIQSFGMTLIANHFRRENTR